MKEIPHQYIYHPQAQPIPSVDERCTTLGLGYEVPEKVRLIGVIETLDTAF
jgi:hypothetical protein